MTDSRREWNSALISELFSDEQQRQISLISPQWVHTEDTYSLEYTKTGHYTVKSGYWVQTNVIEAAKRCLAVEQPSLDSLYQWAWKQDTSPKIHHFLWRCISDALPTAANMKYRHISKDGSCSRCGMESETANHILFQCPYARRVWAESPIHAPPYGTMSDSLYSNLYRVLNLRDRYPKEEAHEELVPWLLWRLWKNRNDFLFQSKDYSAPDTVRKAMEDTKKWKGRNEEKIAEVKTTTSSKKIFKWKPPKHNWIKCNTDGSWTKDNQRQGIGWVSRDHSGKLLCAGAQRF